MNLLIDAPLAEVPERQPMRLLHELLTPNGSSLVITAKVCALIALFPFVVVGLVWNEAMKRAR